jgi:hypothetical protein
MTKLQPIESLPKPNTQALSWFFSEHKKGTLSLRPKYQRNPIWSIGQKCFLVDSLISGAPIPQVFVNIKDEGSGKSRRSIYEVVDGQQRLRAILEYMNDDYRLVKIAAKAYPVSPAYLPHVGKEFSLLPGALQDAIWNYPLAVQELRGWDDDQIRALFRRLNYVVERLNKQELRHSQYFGEFVTAVESLAKAPFWDEIGFFSRHDSVRMKDVEFVSELFVLLIDGVQEGQSTLDSFYAEYDVVFPKKNLWMSRFRRVLDSLRTLEPLLESSRFTKKADFYGLFGAVRLLNRGKKEPVDLSTARKRLQRLEKELERPESNLSDVGSRYHATVIEGPNKKPKRTERVEMLTALLNGE